MSILPHKICDAITINAGIGGATVGTFAAGLGNRLIGMAKPSLVVIALGTNDTTKHRKIGIEKILRQYERFLHSIQGQGTSVVLANIPPVEAGKPLGTDYFSTIKIAEFNRAVEALAEKRGIPFVDLHAALSDPEGEGMKNTTTDGVHLTPASYRKWKAALIDAIERKTQMCSSKQGQK